MNQLLQTNQTVLAQSSKLEITVDRFLGGGGQGEVYAARLQNQSVALKWYFPSSVTLSQRAALDTLVKCGPPSQRFLWPIDLAVASDVAGFGYVMPLREERFKSIVDLMKRRVDPSFSTLTYSGFLLAHSFLILHTEGLCYRDISFGNVFFDPDDGEILIADNDNVTVNGTTEGGVLGTPRFMAPEVVRGDARPSTQTDLFSLAVLLFYMFMQHHPLEGKRESSIRCLDLPAMNDLYGFNPLFIFDPNDQSNWPHPVYHKNALAFWPIYPEFLRELFTRAFTEGIRDPDHGRVRESEWRMALVRLRDSIIYCSQCSNENFYDGEALKESNGESGACWSCQGKLQYPPRIRIDKRVIMLNYDTRLFPHHVDGEQLYVFNPPVAEVSRHPADPNVWGLKNLSAQKWVSTTSDGTVKDVDPGRSVSLTVGTRIISGKAEGEIRV